YFEAREHRISGFAQTQHIVWRGERFEHIVGPFGKNIAVGVLYPQRLWRELDQHVPAKRRVSVEEQTLPCLYERGLRSWRHHRPPTLSASASPSPTGEAASPAAATRSSLSRLDISNDSARQRQRPSLNVA